MISGFDLSDLAFLSAVGGKPYGEAVFSTPGTYSWTAPALVKSVSVVCIGGGGGTPIFTSSISRLNGAGGGGLGWRNSISVTPGTSYTVFVGSGGSCVFTSLLIGTGGNGLASYFISSDTVLGGGGIGARSSDSAFGGIFVGDGGGFGGNGGICLATSGFGGSGGAGGYSGNGGNGGAVNSNGTFVSATDGSGGGGGGGASADSSNNLPGAGGGTGIFGQGISGLRGTRSDTLTASHGTGGSSGTNGFYATKPNGAGIFSSGGLYGGGSNTLGGNGPASSDSTFTATSGVVRIIWGEGRAFPSTNVGPSQ
jgi:hypothetical protein